MTNEQKSTEVPSQPQPQPQPQLEPATRTQGFFKCPEGSRYGILRDYPMYHRQCHGEYFGHLEFCPAGCFVADGGNLCRDCHRVCDFCQDEYLHRFRC